MLKKFSMLVLCLLTVFGLSACSQSKNEQKEVVKDFFTFFEKGDFESIKKISKNDLDFIEEYDHFEKQFDKNILPNYSDLKDTYKKYFSSVMDTLLESYEIEKVEKDTDHYIVTVNVKFRDSKSLQKMANSKYWQEKTENYIKENKENLIKIQKEKGQDGVFEKVFNDLLPIIFKEINDTLSKAEIKESTLLFKLTEQNDQWVIEDIDSKYE